MSIKKANSLMLMNRFQEALIEYKKIDPSNPLYQQAQFNINLLQKKNYKYSKSR